MTEFENLIINDYPELIEVIDIIDESFLEYYDKHESLESNLYYYARNIIKGRWSEAEKYIMKNPGWACWYALDITKARWPEAEPIIIKNSKYAYIYAYDVIKGRWSEAEPYIKQDKRWWNLYCERFKL